MIKKEHLRTQIIEQALLDYDDIKPGAYSQDAVELLMGTAATESNLGYHFVQNGGPALGIFQIEPNTAIDNWVNYLRYKPEEAEFVRSVISPRAAEYIFFDGKVRESIIPSREFKAELITNLTYQVIMARIKYLRAKGALPDRNNVVLMGDYWKEHYNTHLGAGTVEHFVEKYSDLAL